MEYSNGKQVNYPDKMYMLGEWIEGSYQIDFTILTSLKDIFSELESTGYDFIGEDEGGYEYYNEETDSNKKVFHVQYEKPPRSPWLDIDLWESYSAEEFLQSLEDEAKEFEEEK